MTQSLSDFLAQRVLESQAAKAAKAPKAGSPLKTSTPEAQPQPKVTEAPSPQSEPKALPDRVTPPPVNTPTYKSSGPGHLRKFAGAVAQEVFKGTGHVGKVAVGAISGTGHSGSSGSPGSRFEPDAVKARATPSGTEPDDKPIGSADSIEDLEKQIVQLDKQQKAWGQYLNSEIQGVREDVKVVSIVASNAMKTVRQIQRDQKTKDFAKQVSGAQFRGKNGRFMSAQQAIDNPDDLHPDLTGANGPNKKKDDDSLVSQLLKWALDAVSLEGLGEGALAVGGLFGAKKLTNMLKGKSAPAPGSNPVEEILKNGPKETPEAPAPGVEAPKGATPKSLLERGGSILERGKSALEGGLKGGLIGVGTQLVGEAIMDKTMGTPEELYDADVKKYGEDKAKELYATRTEGAIHRTWDRIVGNPAQGPSIRPEDKEVKGDAVSIKSDKNVDIKASQSVNIESGNDLTIRAKTITLDAQKVTITENGKEKSIGGVSAPAATAATTKTPPGTVFPGGTSKVPLKEDTAPATFAQRFDAVKGSTPSSDAVKSPDLTPMSGGTVSGGRDLSARLPKGAIDPKEIYKYLREKGLDHEHAVGMVNNAFHESKFKASDDTGDQGTSGGLFQFHNDRMRKMTQFVGKDWSTDWKGQIDYALTEPQTQRYLSQQFKDSSEASKFFTKNWEVPKYKDQRAEERLSTIKNFDSLKYEGGKSQKDSQPDSTKTLANLIQGDQKPTAAAVDLALKNEGMHEVRDRQVLSDYLRKGPNAVDPARTPWCAAYVNASLAQEGVKGTGSAIATSFMKWGIPVPDATKIQKGDVVVESRGHSAGETGGHVGMATGKTRTTKSGQFEYEMVAGNDSDRVRRTWVPENRNNVIRRVAEEKKVAEKELTQTEPVTPKKKDSDVRVAMNDATKLTMPTQPDTWKTMSLKEKLSDAGMDKLDKAWFDRVPDDQKKVSPSDDQPASFEDRFSAATSQPKATPPVQGLDVKDSPFQPPLAPELGPEPEAPTPDASMVKDIPTPPNLDTNTDPDAGQKLTDSIRQEGMTPEDKRGSQVANNPSVGTSGSETGGRTREHISAPVNHPESEPPRPGTDGYGDQQHDPDAPCYLCTA